MYLNWILMCLYFDRKKLPSCYLVKIEQKLPNRLFPIWCDKINMWEMDKNKLILYKFTDKNNLILYKSIIFLKQGVTLVT